MFSCGAATRLPFRVIRIFVYSQTNLFEMSSRWVGMNLLSIDQETVIVDERQKNFIKFLEQNKIKVIPVKMRHIYTQGGGIHCATLDTVRDSKLEDYFN